MNGALKAKSFPICSPDVNNILVLLSAYLNLTRLIEQLQSAQGIFFGCSSYSTWLRYREWIYLSILYISFQNY